MGCVGVSGIVPTPGGMASAPPSAKGSEAQHPPKPGAAAPQLLCHPHPGRRKVWEVHEVLQANTPGPWRLLRGLPPEGLVLMGGKNHPSAVGGAKENSKKLGHI